MGLRTDLEHSVRQALNLTETEYYERLSLILADARRLRLIGVADGAMDLSLDHWHVPYWGEKLIGRYGYHCNGMMSRPFPGIHPLTAYDLTDGCFVLITPPPSSSADDAVDVTGLEGLSLCERLGLKVESVRGDRGLSTVEFVKGDGLEGTTYYRGVKANSILREHIRGRGWVENEETGERTCVRRNLDYHGVRTNLIALSKMDRNHPGRRRVFLFITNDDSRSDPFDLLDQYRMRGEHKRSLGCLSALGVKHLPSTESMEEIAGHLLLFVKLQFLLKLFCERFGIKRCEPKTLANLFFARSGISWTDGSGSRKTTIIFSNRAAIRKFGRTRLNSGDGHGVVLIEQWRGHRKLRQQQSVEVSAGPPPAPPA